MSEKSDGRRLFEITYRTSDTGDEWCDESMNAKNEMERIAEAFSAPLLARIAELEKFVRPCDSCGLAPATIIEPHSGGPNYVCSDCHAEEIAARVAE